ncbi:MAG: Ca-activated chloride channel family protein [Planctomycetota bacterium]|jgi:Ca-activated chloride channel family protein
MDGSFTLPFRHPLVLLFLVIPALLLCWVWQRRGRALILPFDHASDRALQRGRWLGVSMRLANSLPALLLGLVVCILAGPLSWSEPKTKRALTNIEFCVDVSGSMMAQFGPGTRYDASMQAIIDFLEFRSGDAFGLTFFGNSVLRWVPLTDDVSAFKHAPEFMVPGKLPSWFNGTEIGRALRSCRQTLMQREEGDRMIILITDGYSADLSGGKDEEIARALRDAGIVVYAVNVSGQAAHASIVKITSMTDGEVFDPGDPSALEFVFQRIDEMQETKIEKTAAEAVDNYVPWCEAGLVLLGLTLLVSLGLRPTPW